MAECKQCDSIAKLAAGTSNTSTRLKCHHPLFFLGSPVGNSLHQSVYQYFNFYPGTDIKYQDVCQHFFSFFSSFFFVPLLHSHSCQCLGFLTCTQMSMYVTAEGGCRDTAILHRKLALGENSRAAPESRPCVSSMLDPMPHQLSYIQPPPPPPP